MINNNKNIRKPNYFDTPQERRENGDFAVNVISYLLGFDSPKYESDWRAEDLENKILVQGRGNEESKNNNKK